jgi:hypothetical protein
MYVHPPPACGRDRLVGAAEFQKSGGKPPHTHSRCAHVSVEYEQFVVVSARAWRERQASFISRFRISAHTHAVHGTASPPPPSIRMAMLTHSKNAYGSAVARHRFSKTKPAADQSRPQAGLYF